MFSCFGDACELISRLPSMGQNIGKWSILLWVAWKHSCRRSSTQVRRVCRQTSLSSAQGLLHNAAVPGMLAYFCVVATCVELSGVAGMAQSDRKRSVSSLASMGPFLPQQKQSKAAEVAPDVAILSARVALKIRPCQAESVLNANFKILVILVSPS